jgi:hypothetical protein
MLALLLACSPEDDTGTEKDSAPPLDTSIGTDCSGTSPEIHDVSTGTDTITAEDGTEQATITFTIEVEDDDADLAPVTIDLFWDATVDGTVDTVEGDAWPGEPYQDSSWEECAVQSLTITSAYGVTGSPLDGDTTYEFAVVVTDAAGLASEPYVLEATTPTEL